MMKMARKKMMIARASTVRQAIERERQHLIDIKKGKGAPIVYCFHNRGAPMSAKSEYIGIVNKTIATLLAALEAAQ